MIHLRMISIVVLIGACSDLPGKDDPRTASDGSDSPQAGSCNGYAADCEDRLQNQCNSGCTFQPICKSVNLENCLNHREADACDADTRCYWSLDVCNTSNDYCGAYQSQTACANDPLPGDCAWGPACTGSRSGCFEEDTAAACTANLGCTWSPG